MNDKPRKSLEELQAEARAADGLGLVCPRCGWTSLPVLYTRRLPKNETARVRQCRKCGTKVLCKERIVVEIAPARAVEPSEENLTSGLPLTP